jgi:hypothetical protein
MQQVQEKQQQQKMAANHSAPQPHAYRPSPVPFVLATSAKVCYGLSAASLVVSVTAWNRVRFSLPFTGKRGKKAAKAGLKPTPQQYREAQRLGAFVGLLTPTLAVAGKILDDASERIAQYDFAQWEKKQAEKARSSAFRLFNR